MQKQIIFLSVAFYYKKKECECLLELLKLDKYLFGHSAILKAQSTEIRTLPWKQILIVWSFHFTEKLVVLLKGKRHMFDSRNIQSFNKTYNMSKNSFLYMKNTNTKELLLKKVLTSIDGTCSNFKLTNGLTITIGKQKINRFVRLFIAKFE